jgi:hypothetical protein
MTSRLSGCVLDKRKGTNILTFSSSFAHAIEQFQPGNQYKFNKIKRLPAKWWEVIEI